MGKLMDARVQGIIAFDGRGRFLSRMDAAANRTAERIGAVGANSARANAPIRTGRLVASIENVSQGNTARWEVGTDHWHFVEYGTSAHTIYGKLRFNWRGGHFYWNNPKFPNNQDKNGAWVYHPGTTAQPFMQPSYAAAKAVAMAIAREEFPG